MPVTADRRPDRYLIIAGALALAVLLPVSVLLSAWRGDESETWRHLVDTVLWRLLGHTAWLVIGVGIGVLLLGVSLAWLVATQDFPGRRVLDWALLLPLAMPSYVLAFVVVQGLDYAGPVQTVLRQWWPGFSGFSARHPFWVIATLSLVFYPYVYMLARLAFLTQGRAVMEQARLLGRGPWAAFFQVALPMARPAIAAGLALALMETLADFGAVSVFNFDTFTTAIYKSWYGLFNLAAAAQLASLLLLFVLLALWLERRGRGRARYGDRGGRPMVAVRSRWAWLMTCYAGLVVVLAFVLPAGRLLYWTLAHADAGHQRRRAGGGAGFGAGLAAAPAATPVDARAGAHSDDGVCAARLGAGGGDRHRLRRHRPPVGAMVRLEATAGGQSRGAVPGLCDPLHGGGLWSGGKRPGTGSPGFAGSRPDSWCAAAGSGTAGAAADGGAGADHGFVAGGHRHNEGNAGHASASSLRLGHPGRAHL